MSDAADEKIMGLVPKSRYMYFTYMFLLVRCRKHVLFHPFHSWPYICQRNICLDGSWATCAYHGGYRLNQAQEQFQCD